MQEMHVGLYNFLYLLNQWRGLVLLMMVAAGWAMQRFAPVECAAATLALCATFLGGYYIKWHIAFYDLHHWPGVGVLLALPTVAWLLCQNYRLRAYRRTIWLTAITGLFVVADGHMDYGAIFSPGRPWQAMACLALLWRFGYWLARNADLGEHRGHLRFILICSFVAFLAGWFLGQSTGHPGIGLASGIFLALVPCLIGLRMANKALSEVLGGLIFDMVFCEGDFAEKGGRAEEPLPNLTLLRHWRENGSARKAWRAAQPHLVENAGNYPVWLFAAETAAMHLGRPQRAIKIIRRLDHCEAFTRDQKEFAVQELKAWLAILGRDLDLQQFHSKRGAVEKRGPMAKAAGLRQQGRFKEAVSLLESLMARNPENLAAALLLMRVYAQDMKRPQKAEKLLAAIESQPHVAAGLVEYARSSIPEWNLLAPAAPEQKKRWFGRGERADAAPAKVMVSGPPGAGGEAPEDEDTIESRLVARRPAKAAPTPVVKDDVDALLRNGNLGTAVELLEQRIKEEPKSFERWIKLADAHANFCHNPHGAIKIIREMERSSNFTPEQIGQAQSLLKKWCAGQARSLYGV